MAKSPQRFSENSSHLWLWGIHACRAALENPKRRCFRLVITDSTLNELSFSKESVSCKIEILESSSLSRLLPEGAVHQGIAIEVAPLLEMPLQELSKAIG